MQFSTTFIALVAATAATFVAGSPVEDVCSSIANFALQLN